MSRDKVQTVIENAISKADNSYFFENYTKQAQAVIKALDAAGFAVVPNDFPSSVFVQAANEMRTGKLRQEEHVKDVYQTILRLAAAQK